MNIYYLKLFEIHSKGILLDSSILLGNNYSEKVYPTNFDESDLKDYLNFKMSIDKNLKSAKITESTKIVYLTNDEEISSKFKKCVLRNSQKSTKTILRLRNNISGKKLKSLLARISQKFDQKLKIGKNCLVLNLSKNVVCVLLRDDKKWIYQEYDLYSFKRLKFKQRNAIFQNNKIKNIRALQGTISIRNSPLFKTSLYYKLKHEKIKLDRRQGLKIAQNLDRSISSIFQCFYDHQMDIYVVRQNKDRNTVYFLDGKKFHVLDEVCSWDKMIEIIHD